MLRGGGEERPTGDWHTYHRESTESLPSAEDSGDTSSSTGAWERGREKASAWLGNVRLRRSKPDVWNKISCLRRSQELVHFAVRCSDTQYGENVVVVGNTAELGNMDAAKGTKLYTTPESFPLWRGAAHLPLGRFKYRYAILQEGGASEREREHFPDHVHRRVKVLPPRLGHAVLLATDLDGTLIGNQTATNLFFNEWWRYYRGRGSKLVYNTGRPLASAMKLIESKQIRVPNALVCSEGTEVYWFDKESHGEVPYWFDKESHGEVPIPEIDEEWRDRLNSSWRYPELRQAVAQTAESYKPNVKQVMFLADRTDGQPMIVIAMKSAESSESLLRELDQNVRVSKGLEFDVVISSSTAGWYVLLLPPGAGKGIAAVHVADRLGFPPERVIVAGDGENDVPLFEAAMIGARGILVGNSCDALRNWVAREKLEGVYISKASHAAGMIEGLGYHFRLLEGGGGRWLDVQDGPLHIARATMARLAKSSLSESG